ncbi:unnamed protein product [Adineta ricciae]|uniref:Uncharacterized protein n=1 Tax=Adineta ricciae TaxID=249248 RepID=A0A816B575_ADIRI|nr:unnamed protein product [Adineta ricciae]
MLKQKTKGISTSTNVETSKTVSPEITTVYSSTLSSSDALYVRPNTPWPNAGFHYQSIRLRIKVAGLYTILSNSTMDTHGYIYKDTFNSLSPYKNLLLEDADTAENGQFKFTIFLSRVVKYTIVVTTYKAATMGTFSLIIHGPSSTVLSLSETNPPDRIQWLFDGDLNDVYGRYNGQLKINGNNTTTWMSPGYAGYGSAACFSSNNYMIVKRYMNLTSTKLTISAWIWIPDNLLSSWYFFPLFTYCAWAGQDMCLHMAVAGGKLRLGFYGDDLDGNIALVFNQWYYVTYSYDPLSLQQRIYVNGIVDGIRTPNHAFQQTANVIVIGGAPLITDLFSESGFIDKLTFESRVKSSEEILDEATLVAYYPFDNSYDDVGPNQMINSTFLSTMFDSDGRFDQCLLINSTNLSYFQSTGFYYLGQTNYPFSFSLWIYPFINNGTILQMSSIDGWCVPTIGFDSSGRLTIQILGANGIYSSSFTSGTISLNQWTHIVMTYSKINGIQLFVNGSFSSENMKHRTYSATGSRYTILVGTSLPSDICSHGKTQIVPLQFRGKIDELKIFSRELSFIEIAQLAQVTIPYEYGSSSLWQFDKNALDSISNHHGVTVNSPSYVTPGITGNGYALKVNRNQTQYVTVSTNQSFHDVSFTIEMWIYPIRLTKSDIFGLFSQYDSMEKYHFLRLTIQDSRLYMGFYNDGLECRTELVINTWYHVAFVYDYRSRSQNIYLNGNQDCHRSAAGSFKRSQGPIHIGTHFQNVYNCFDGETNSVLKTENNEEFLIDCLYIFSLIDNVALTMRTKTDMEILDDATLITWHSFDSVSWKDSSTFGLTATANNVNLVSGKVNHALNFNSSSAYYQISGFVLLGISNRSYSISLWIKRASNSGGVLVHLSTQINGTGWCTTLMGFQVNGQFVVNNGNFSENILVVRLLPINVWTHIVVTYSLRNGLILYINGIFYGTTGEIPYTTSGEASILTLGNLLSGSSCYRGSITSDVYVGDIDEFRVYSRELSTTDVYELASP